MPTTLIEPSRGAAWSPERRKSVRVTVNMDGRYVLANKRNPKGKRCEFPCRIVNISPRAVALAASLVGKPGERVIVYTETFGTLQGVVLRVVRHGFVMTIAARSAERERLTAKLAWLVKQQRVPAPADGRRSPRIVPRDPVATLGLPDGTTVSCLVIDISRTGVAVSADFRPKLHTEVAVGEMRGRVVRTFAEGFAIEFVHNRH